MVMIMRNFDIVKDNAHYLLFSLMTLRYSGIITIAEFSNGMKKLSLLLISDIDRCSHNENDEVSDNEI